MHYLNIAALCTSTKVLGPGKRFIIWVQGCCFCCYHCGSPDWRDQKDEILITPNDLARKVLDVPGLEGITISGGEPMLQAETLLELIRLVRLEQPLSVICYTGFTLEELREKRSNAVNSLLSEIDVLIDGRYIDSLNDNIGLRGSSNQKVHFLTGKYKDAENMFLFKTRDLEIHLSQNHYLIVGIKPKEFKL